jgi:ligand-binding sensor domain-containing protein/signal transduction histidine kinase
MKLLGFARAIASLPLNWVLTVCLSWPLVGFPAQTNEGVLSYTVRGWQTDDGLPQNSVYALAQTTDGYLWVGTREGLARFDGLSFTIPETPGAPELQRAWIADLCTTRDGSLWIAADSLGLFRLRDGVVSRYTEKEGFPGSQPRCLLEARDGSIWVGTEDRGIAHFQHGRFSTFDQHQGLGDNSVRCIHEDGHGVIRAATKRGLSTLLPNGSFTNQTGFGAGWIGNALRFLHEDRRGNLWVGSTDGLSCLREGGREFYGLNEGLPDKVINALLEDDAGQLWVGTYSGLARLVDGHIVARPNREAVFGDLVYSLFEDRESNLWIGARDGLYRLTPARFTTYTTQEGLSGNNVMSVCEDPSGTLWLGIWGGGLNALRDGKVTAFTHSNGLPRDSVLALHQGREHNLWLGMEAGGGLEEFKEGRRVSWPRQSGFIGDAIRVIHQDSQGGLWVGTSSNLCELRGGKMWTFTTTNGLAGDMVLALCEDSSGNLWIGTDGGLSCCKDRRFTNFTVRNGLSHNSVDALYEDRDHTLWIGTRGGGLNRLKDGRFTAYTTHQGLFSDEIYEILEDDFGYFWMSCRRGIFRVARKELEDLERGAIKLLTGTAFNKADGLLSVQCNGVAKPGGWKGRDGRLWFPTIRGVVAVDSRIKTNDKPPPVAVEQILADRKVVLREASAGSELWRVPPGRGDLEIHYTALSMQAPEKNRFKYMLEGADSTWNDVGPLRTARYNHLLPGNYRFHVCACNNDGVWNETGAIVPLLLLPHFWQTWWFRPSLLAAGAALLTLLYRLRVARLRELERLRVEIAANLHDDVGARLTKVAMITELVDHETSPRERSKPHIQALARTTREVIRAMDEIVWTINPNNDTLENLANYIFQHAQDYFQNTNVRCRLDMPAQLPDRPISTDMRHNLFMAVKEALNNVLKHSGATEVRITLAVSPSQLTLTIVDNGRGFVPEQARPAGNGLRNMKARLEKFGGRLTLDSQPGAGTTIRMEAPPE